MIKYRLCKYSSSFMLLIIMGLFSVIISCGSGGGGGGGGGGEPEYVSISVEGGQTVRYTQVANSNTPDGYSPNIWSNSSQPTDAHIYCGEWGGTAYSMQFQIEIYDFPLGIHTGNYLINKFGNRVQFSPQGGATYSTIGTGTSGTITITEFGKSGGMIKGTFDVVANVTSIPTSTAHLTGSFSATRWDAY